MDILVLEDEKYRIDWLRENMGIFSITHVETVDAFKRLMPCTPTLVILDHDLGEGAGTGMDAVRALKVPLATPILIWSINVVRAPVMEQALKQAGYTTVLRNPFTWDKHEDGMRSVQYAFMMEAMKSYGYTKLCLEDKNA